MVPVLFLLRTMTTLLKCNLAIMCAKVVVVTNIAALEKTRSNNYVQQGTKHAMHVASGITSENVDKKLEINKVPYRALGMKETLWMSSLHMLHLSQKMIPSFQSMATYHKEVEATLIPFSPYPDPRWAKDIPNAYRTRFRIYPDSGVTICPSGPKHLQNMGLSEINSNSAKIKFNLKVFK